ncbi:MAG TPA: hypothetical protein VKB79_01460 [Bryobacteraceae bacterium]|nr:hypothetical protein [Bryobacteraceae bacterium]
MRRRVLDGGRGGPGLDLLQREGMKSWIQTRLRLKGSTVKVDPSGDTGTTGVAFFRDLAQLIAVMILEIHQQGAMS